MYLQTLLCLVSLLHLKVEAKPTSNVVVVAVVGSAFCDSCSENAYSKRSYFLKGAKVLIQCRFGRTSIAANTTTDHYGVYKLDIPLPGRQRFKCRQGREMISTCRALLTDTASSHCSLPGLRISTSHVAVKPRSDNNLCILNMNAVSSRPRTRDVGYCSGGGSGRATRPQSTGAAPESSLFCFWPLYPPLGLPWLHWPPLPFTFPPLPFPFNILPLPPGPSSLPFSLPPWLLPFLDPASLPFPFSLLPPLIPIPTLSAPPPPPYPFSLGQP